MKKVVVTGATGFIGRHCLPLLEERGYEVVPLSSKKCDLLDEEEVKRFFTAARPSHLLHLAWETTPGKFWTAPENLQWLEASRHLLQTFQAFGGVRVAVAGTCAEYDPRSEICSEALTRISPATLYGKCKNELRLFLETLNLSHVWARIFNPYGPYDDPKKLISSVILSLLGKKPALCTHGNQIRDYLYVSDVAAALVALLDTTVEGPINIGSGQPLAVKEVCLKIAEKIGKPELLHLGALPAPKDDPARVVADLRLLSEKLDWQPKVSLDEGLEQTIKWMQEFIT